MPKKAKAKNAATKTIQKPDLGVDDLNLEDHAVVAEAGKADALPAATKKIVVATKKVAKPDLDVDDLDLEDHSKG